MTPFEQLMLELPPESRCVQTDRGDSRGYPRDFCFFGVPPDDRDGRAVLERMPANPPGAAFLMGRDQLRLLNAFVNSGHGHSIQRLIIGNSCYQQGAWDDYSALMPCLIGADFPALRILELGDWVGFWKGPYRYGLLGDITEPLQWLTQVKLLYLYGHFELNRSLKLPHLKRLEFNSDGNGTGSTTRPLSLQTVERLMNSWMPEVECLELQLHNYAETPLIYPLPAGLVDGTQFPVLLTLGLDRHSIFESDRQRLLNGLLSRRRGMYIDPEYR